MQQEEQAPTPEEVEQHDLQDAPRNNEHPSEAPEEHHHGAGGIIGIIILVLLIALGGLYFWSMSDEAPVIEEPVQPAQPAPDPVVEELMQMERSDELDAIERDLFRTDLDAIDADLDQLEMELEAALEASM